MKIVKPTLREAQEYYSKNRIYYEQLSSYYSVHDPEFHKNIFLKIESKIINKSLHESNSVTIVYVMTIIILISLSILYIFPFRIEVGYTAYDVSRFSLIIRSRELTDFEKGVDKFNKSNYILAIDYFRKVDANDDNYQKSIEMIGICNIKIDEEGVTKSEGKNDKVNETDKSIEDDNLIH